MTDNELIAEFMGFEVTGTMPVSQQRIYSLPYIDTSLSNHYFGPHRSEQMRFDTSWDWLMPVVEKIEELGYYPQSLYLRSEKSKRHFFNITDQSHHLITDQLEEVKINAVYNAVVEFIKWHNSNKP